MKTCILFLCSIFATVVFCQVEKPILIPIDSAGYYSFYNPTGDRLTKWKKADEINIDFENQFYTYRQGRTWGITNENLDSKTPPSFTSIYIRYNLIFAEKYNRLLVLNMDLDTLLDIDHFIDIEFDPNYVNSRRREGVLTNNIIVQTRNGYGILSDNLKWEIEPFYSSAFFMDNIIYLRKDDKFGFYSTNNKLIDAKWSAIGLFNNSILEVWDENDHREYFYKDGRKLPFSDSTLVYYAINGNFKIYKNGKGHIYNTQLNEIIRYSGTDVFELNPFFALENFFQAQQFRSDDFAIKKGGKIGVIDKNGRQIIPAEYEHIRVGGKGLYIAMKDQKFGIITTNNTVITPFEYTYITPVYNYFHVVDRHKKGVLTQKGDTLIPIIYEEIRHLFGGVITQLNGRYGYYTLEGKEILKPIYLKCYSHNGGLEFIAANGDKCMVNENGLITPLNCNRISKNNTKLKYYFKDSIAIHNLKDGRIIDTTYYQVKKTIPIDNRWGYSHPISIVESEHIKFTHQLSGKIGILKKEDTGYSVAPQFFNIFRVNHYYYCKKVNSDFLKVDNAFISTKEMTAHFYSVNGNISEYFYSLLNPNITFFGRHKSDIDPIITASKKWRYYSENRLVEGEFPYIQKRSSFTTGVLREGELNFNEGDDLMPFKAYYSELNEEYNLIITSKFEFDRLAKNPIIKIKDALWDIYAIDTEANYKLHGTYTLFNELETAMKIVKNKAGKYGLFYAGDTPLIPTEMSAIIPVQVNEFEYYRVQKSITDLAGISTPKWTIYNFGGQVLPDYYDQVEVLSPNAFKIQNGNTEMVIDSLGTIIYAY